MSSIQAAIEKEAGITNQIAQYMMNSGTIQAKRAMSILRMAVDHYDTPTMALLVEAVKDCKNDLESFNRSK